MPQFTWITFAQAKAALAARLQQTSKVYFVDDEIGRYLIEGLRTWNALTNVWIYNYDLSPLITPNQVWYSLQSTIGYPRVRTVTDQELFVLMCYHLIEQPEFGIGGFGFNFGFNFGLGSSSGTGMWTVQDFANALQRRRDEIFQLTACNLSLINLPATPGIRTANFPDSVLSPIRSRFLPVGDDPITLWRNDDLALEYFSTEYLQNQARDDQAIGINPKTYGVIAQAPLQFATDFPPGDAGQWEFLVVQSGVALAPPVATVLGLPNDFAWVAKWGAMSDLLGMESEVTDPARADYCLQRYRDGITLLQKAPWLILATIDNEPVETASVQEMDNYSIEWDSNPNASTCVVSAGQDFVAVSPVPGTPPPPTPGVTLRLVGNAPIPVNDSDFVQVSRDTFDVILDYAQHLADFKMGGSDFSEGKELAKNFFLAATLTNSRLTKLGLFRDLLLEQGERQGKADPRFREETEDK